MRPSARDRTTERAQRASLSFDYVCAQWLQIAVKSKANSPVTYIHDIPRYCVNRTHEHSVSLFIMCGTAFFLACMAMNSYATVDGGRENTATGSYVSFM